ncbi:glycerol dehydrogenase [Salinigranum sp.]|uniref:glycerol dehydrogenase n=1 Tax=Salinigranum sp. TaxID=1966351 RepID=UPI0035660C9C
MTRTFVAPPRYLQGVGTLDDVGTHVSRLGGRALVVTDEVVADVVGESVTRSLSDAGVDYRVVTFGGECTRDEISRLTDVAQNGAVDVVVGVGGGKVVDVAKGVRSRIGGRLVTLPTIASTDAPTSGLSVVYTDDGSLAGGIVHDERPDLVLVDTAVVAAAPVRWFVSGIGDALATRFEARATRESGGWTFAGGSPSQAGVALAERCYDVLRAHGPAAVDAVRDGTVTDDVEETVEAIVLLSGLGFENGGLAAAHAVHDGIVSVGVTGPTHGEMVCFGLLTQLVLEGRSDEEIRDVARFASDIGLPVTLADIGVSPDRLGAVAEATCRDETSIDNQPGDPTPDAVTDALRTVDELGRSLE